MSVRDAIVLAAGMGVRLRTVLNDRPKGLIEIEGESLMARSVRLLGRAGIEQITIVTGYRAELYERFAGGLPHLRLVRNDCFETTGSMASLALALDVVRDREILVLESDIAYESRALDEILAASGTATLVSGPTGAGDEVWVCAPGGRVASMSKSRGELPSVDGEFVGITRLSAEAAAAMREAFRRFTAANGHGRMDYETGALVGVAEQMPVAARLVPDLCWGEIDDERHHARMVSEVWPILARERVQ